MNKPLTAAKETSPRISVMDLPIPDETWLWRRCYLLIRFANEELNYRAEQKLKKWDLNISQYGVLRTLHEDGPMSLSALSRRIFRINSHTTRIVDQLVKRKFIQRKRLHPDRRVIEAHLTPKGESFIRGVIPEYREYLQSIMSVVEDDELLNISKGLQGLLEGLTQVES